MAGGWSARARMSGPLVGCVDGFEAELARLGYTPASVAHQLRLIAHLDGWLAEQRLDATALTAAVVGRFMAERRAAGCRHMRTPRSLEPLLVYLRAAGIAPAPTAAVAVTPAERLLDRYRRYLVLERGLTAGTARSYATVVRPFLVGRESASGLDLETLGAGDVTAFVAVRCRTRRGREVVSALRSLLGFLHVEGLVGGELARAVPAAAGWRLAGLPQALQVGQARLLLASCDRETVVGRRDLAILAVLTRLGLRVGEVAALALDDIQWRAGEIVVTNGKRGRREPMPLPVDVGEAIAEYLRSGRPAGAVTRCVFVRAHAPLCGLTGGGVADVVVAACRRAGIDGVGAHRLRHTAASDILRAGAGLAEVGQVLRHRLPRTTAIYAKVDLQALRLLARPWPEAAS